MRTARRSVVMVAAWACLAVLLVPVSAGAVPAVAPSGLSPTGPVTSNPEFTWDPVVGATQYRFQISADEAFGSTILNQTTYNTTFIHTAELPVGSLHWRVAAIDGTGQGPWSDTASIAKTLSAPDPLAPVGGEFLDYPNEPPTFQWTAVDAANSYLLEIDDADDFIGATKITTTNTTFTYDDTQEIGQTFYWRVRGASTSNGSGVLTPWSTNESYQIRWDAPPVLLGPPNSTSEPITDVTLAWEPVLGAARYQLQVNINIEFNGAHTVNVSNLLGATYRKATPFLNGSYFWRVRAIDPDGHVGPWSATWAFTRGWPSVSPCCGSADDGVPDLVHPPITGVQPEPPYFEWTPVERASHYEVQTNGGTCVTIQTRVYHHTGGKSLPGSCPTSFWQQTSGTWRVRAIDGATDIVGLWSEWQSFQRSGVTPGIIGPPGGAHVDVPTVAWNPVQGADRYRVAVYDAAGNVLENDITYATSFTPKTYVYAEPEEEGDPIPARTLRWGVMVYDGSGVLPAPMHTFVLDPPEFAPAPDPVAPADSSVTVQMPALQWEPVADASRYTVYVAPMAAPVQAVMESNLRNPGWTEPDGYSVAMTGWLAPGAYEWWVVARVGNADVTGSTGVFTIAGLGDAPVYLAPTFCGPTDACAAELSSPLLSWAYQYFATYNVYLAYDQFFTNIDRSYATRYARFVPREELPDNDVGQAYFWHVQTCRIDGAPVCSPHPQGIATHNSAFRKLSEAVDPIGPGEELTDPPPVPLPVEVTDQELDFRWEHYLPSNLSDLEAERYRFQASTVPSFSSTLENLVTDNTAHTPMTVTYPEGPIYWRVRAIDASGNELTWSPTFAFRKSTPFPMDPADEEMIKPAHGAGLTGDPDFSWPPQPGAREYVLEIYKDADLQFSPTNRVLNKITVQSAFTPLAALPPGEYAWRLRREDPQGKDGPWMAGRTFTIQQVGLSLNTPADGAVFDDNNLVFRWFTDPAVATYRFQRSNTAGFASITESVNTVASAFAPTAKYPDGTWYWRVLPLNAGGAVVGTSAVRSFTKVTLEVPGAPTGVSAVAGDEQVTVSWTPPVSDGGDPITQYRVTGAPGGEVIVPAPATSAAVTGLTNGQAYTFVVRAVNSRGEGPPSAATAGVTPSAPPGAPTAVVGAPGNGAVAVSWTTPASNGGSPIFLYTVSASPGSATCNSISNGCTVTGLTNGVAYTFTVVAFNAAGASPTSAPSAPVVPFGVPGSPTGVSGNAGNGQVTVSWVAPASTGGSPITGYTATASPGGATCTTTGATSCAVTGLTNGTSYTFTVVATNVAGSSAASAASAPVTPVAPAGVPSAPTSVSGVAGNAQVTVSWSAPGSDGGSPITGYTATATPGGATCSTGGALSCAVSGLTNGTAYTFTVVASNAAGSSAASAASAPVTPRAVPGAPTGVSGVPGSGQVTVSWSAPGSDGGSPITGYTVTASPGGATCTTAGATSCAVTGLTNGTAYTFTVVATNAAGNSAPSAASAVVTPVGPGTSKCGPGQPGPFPDVSSTSGFCLDIEWLVDEGITSGFPDNTFRPTLSVSRGSMAAFLYRFQGSPAFTPPAAPTFSDVGVTHPFFKEIQWLVAEGITGGFADGTYRPGVAVSRGSMAAFLYRFADSPAFTPGGATFSDVPASHTFFKDIQWLVSVDVTGGFADGTYRPSNAVSRQAMAAFLHRFDGI